MDVILIFGVMIRVVQVDLFFYREPEESKDRDEEEAAAPEFAAVDYAAPGVGGEQWGPEAAEAAQWEPTDAAAVPAGAPTAEWAAPVAAPVAAGWDVGAAAAPAGWDTAAAAAPAGWEPAAL